MKVDFSRRFFSEFRYVCFNPNKYRNCNFYQYALQSNSLINCDHMHTCLIMHCQKTSLFTFICSNEIKFVVVLTLVLKAQHVLMTSFFKDSLSLPYDVCSMMSHRSQHASYAHRIINDCVVLPDLLTTSSFEVCR